LDLRSHSEPASPGEGPGVLTIEHRGLLGWIDVAVRPADHGIAVQSGHPAERVIRDHPAPRGILHIDPLRQPVDQGIEELLLLFEGLPERPPVVDIDGEPHEARFGRAVVPRRFALQRHPSVADIPAPEADLACKGFATPQRGREDRLESGQILRMHECLPRGRCALGVGITGVLPPGAIEERGVQPRVRRPDDEGGGVGKLAEARPVAGGGVLQARDRRPLAALEPEEQQGQRATDQAGTQEHGAGVDRTLAVEKGLGRRDLQLPRAAAVP